MRSKLEEISCVAQKDLDKSDDMMEALNVDIEMVRGTSNDDNDYKS